MMAFLMTVLVSLCRLSLFVLLSCPPKNTAGIEVGQERKVGSRVQRQGERLYYGAQGWDIDSSQGFLHRV